MEAIRSSRLPLSTARRARAGGHFHSCGITLREKLVCWGGEKDFPFEPPGLFQQVSAGHVHTCGLRKDGNVACWGEDRAGSTRPPPGQFVQVEAGDDFSCGLRPSGLVPRGYFTDESRRRRG